MIEQRPSKIQQVQEFMKGFGLLVRLAFDPRTDPLVVGFFEKRKQMELKQKGERENG